MIITQDCLQMAAVKVGLFVDVLHLIDNYIVKISMRHCAESIPYSKTTTFLKYEFFKMIKSYFEALQLFENRRKGSQYRTPVF